MTDFRSYKIAFIIALLLHLSVVVLLLSETSSERPVLTPETRNEAGQTQPMPSEQPIQAVSVNSDEVMKTVNQLKDERLHQKQAEERRQQVLKKQADQALKQRIAEQKHLEQLKNEAAKLAIARQKQIAEEQLHLKQLAMQKLEQEKHLADLKQRQIQMQKQLEAQKNIELKKKSVELARLEREKAEHAKQQVARENQQQAEKKQAEMAQKHQAAAQQAIADAANAARLAGEVDKYKAMIINAISQQWILPQNVDSSLSSQFRIRLAPNGAVLEVSLMRSSGDPVLDRSAQSAIYKASPLPVPSDPTTFNLFRDISLTVRPVSAKG